MLYPMTAAVFALPLTLSTCFGLSGEPVSPPAPDTALTTLCAGVVALPEAPSVRHWAEDRQRLVDCQARHAGLVSWAQGVTE